jgi:hypothetical protein
MRKLMFKLTKESLLEMAQKCRSFFEMSKRMSINQMIISHQAKQLNIYGQIRSIFRKNRQINPVWTKFKHTRESILELAKKSKSVADIGRELKITRERARQIINKLGVMNEIEKILDLNHYDIEMPPNNSSCVFSIYFSNDPSKRKFFSYTKHIRQAINGYYRWLKTGKKLSHPLVQSCKKFGIKNLKWEIIKECLPGELKKEAHRIITENVGHTMNLKMVQQTKRRNMMLRQNRLEKIDNKPKKSKYPGVYYHRMSGLWMAHPIIPKTGKQKYLGYYHTEEEANSAIIEWFKK